MGLLDVGTDLGLQLERPGRAAEAYAGAPQQGTRHADHEHPSEHGIASPL